MRTGGYYNTQKFRHYVVFSFAVALSAFVCTGQDGPARLAKPIATIGEETIREDQLTPTTIGQLRRLHQEEFETERSAVEEIINHRLLSAEAFKRAITVEKLLETEADSKISEPSQVELTRYYEANRERITQPFEQAKSQLREELRQTKIRDARAAYLRLLWHKANVTTFLEPPRISLSYDPDRIRGSSSAPVTIIEFADFTCPFCRAAESTLKSIADEYKENVRLAYRDFPMQDIRPEAKIAAEASRCAAEEGKFWEYHDLLFERQSTSREGLINAAVKLHLDARRFNSCLDSEKYKSQIEQDFHDGIRAGVFGTPVFFINGIFLGGAQPITRFEQIIDEELAANAQGQQQRCEIVISTATPTVKIGSAPVVTVKLTNNSSHVLDASGNWSDLTNVDPNWLFDVHDSAGKALPRRVFKLVVPATGKAIFRNVSPGGSIVDNVDLTPLYEFKKAGEYRIQVSREVPKEFGGTIKSNIITVTVTQWAIY